MRRCVGVLAVLLASAGLAGCRKPLFSPTEPRSQFDRNDTLRERRAAPKVVDEFGNNRPNIRGRLLGVE